ncbi:MAG: carboxypeptidase M32 [Alphaproteobacteria bacterium]|nr:carboxypeptidase M32 [Alphaproteobacteria bacterium]
MRANDAYAELERRFRRLNSLEEASAVLGWDQQTMMPPGGARARAEQLATIRVLAHGMIIDPALGDLIPAAGAQSGLDDWQRANLREIERIWRHSTALTPDLVERMSHACSVCEMAWREARPKSDFVQVLPHLQLVLDLTREAAQAKSAVFGCSLYDALLDQYEPGSHAKRVDVLFDDLAAFLPGLIGDALEHQARGPKMLPLAGPFPVEQQRQLGLELMKVAGFDFEHGRLDVSLHPFSGGTPEDVRITTRYREDDFMPALMGVMHETGHALYELGLPRDWVQQPVGKARGMAMHESQSLLVEMQACRSMAFLAFAAPLLRKAFGGEGPAWQADNLYRHYTHVERGFIRVDADEATYPAHVILRYRLERALIGGDLKLADLPGAWNEGMRTLVGVAPDNDREGCLQDIHWYDGAFGYFPTYTMGAIAAAQIFEAAQKADRNVLSGIGQGDFRPLLAWLRANIHGRASLMGGTDEILMVATGRPLDVATYKRHLQTRYLS